MDETKRFWESKTLWANLIGIVSLVAVDVAGVNIPAEWSVSILAVINIVLRLVTKKEIIW